MTARVAMIARARPMIARVAMIARARPMIARTWLISARVAHYVRVP